MSYQPLVLAAISARFSAQRVPHQLPLGNALWGMTVSGPSAAKFALSMNAGKRFGMRPFGAGSSAQSR